MAFRLRHTTLIKIFQMASYFLCVPPGLWGDPETQTKPPPEFAVITDFHLNQAACLKIALNRMSDRIKAGYLSALLPRFIRVGVLICLYPNWFILQGLNSSCILKAALIKRRKLISQCCYVGILE
jgi:hypothetical protein